MKRVNRKALVHFTIFLPGHIAVPACGISDPWRRSNLVIGNFAFLTTCKRCRKTTAFRKRRSDTLKAPASSLSKLSRNYDHLFVNGR